MADTGDARLPGFVGSSDMKPVPSTTVIAGGGTVSGGPYLFSDGTTHLYVGRSDNIRRRIGLHCRAGSQHNQATFAFRMARQQTGRNLAAYTKSGSRLQMLRDEVFGPAFIACKARIRSLDLRFVEECNPLQQALLEIYAATVLETPFNDFANH